MSDIFNQTIKNLASFGVSSPRLEARMIFAFLLKKSQSEVGEESILSKQQELLLSNILQRRQNHEPLDKILGHKDFYKYSFIVDDKVLSPRPESEILVEEAIKLVKKEQIPSILEFGVGSGCLILSILSDCPNLIGYGIDKSPQALSVAQKNAELLQVEQRVTFKKADYFSKIDIKEEFSLIISNPPYIVSNEIATLQPEVKFFDPLTALDGGTDGLDHYRRLSVVAKPLLKTNGYILLEIGQGQADSVIDIFIRQNFVFEKVICDLAGIKRCIIFKK